jgi:signal transduction histidine kinase
MEEANEAYSREITLLEERQRIASDLHDAVSQTLFSARLTAEMLLRQPDHQADAFTRSLMDLHRLVRSAAGELRLVLVELRNNALLNVNLNTLLGNLIDSGMARTSANLIFQCHVDDLVLPAQIKLAFYRIAQEAISNAIKHGKPQNIHCILRQNEQTLEMIIKDDGTGFSVDKVSDDHFGMQIMRERADQAEVGLTITTQPGNGTSVTVWWQEEKHE